MHITNSPSTTLRRFGQGLTGEGTERWGSIDWRNAAPFIHSLTYATTTTTIMSGGVAERMKVEVYIFLSAILSSLVYSSMVSWCWSEEGFMAKQVKNCEDEARSEERSD